MELRQERQKKGGGLVINNPSKIAFSYKVIYREFKLLFDKNVRSKKGKFIL